MAAVITDVTIDCAHSTATIVGSGLPTSNQNFIVEINGDIASYTLLSSTSTKAVLQLAALADGEICVAVNTSSLITSNGADILTSDSLMIFAGMTSGLVCYPYTCSVQVTEVPVGIWKLYRFDLKIRQEETA